MLHFIFSICWKGKELKISRELLSVFAYDSPKVKRNDLRDFVGLSLIQKIPDCNY